MTRSVSVKKLLISAGCLAAILVATAAAITSGCDVSALRRDLLSADPAYIAVAFACMAGFVCCESANIGRVLHCLEGESKGALRYLKYGAAGYFFSGITPSASGGQPMQLYFMHRDGTEISDGSLALLMEGLGYQISSMLFAAAGVVYNFDLLKSLGAGVRAVLITGASINLVLIVLLSGVIFSDRFAAGAEKFMKSVSAKFSRRDRTEDIEKQFVKYREGSALIRKYPSLFMKNILTALIQMAMLFTIPYLVSLSIGCAGGDWLRFMLLEAVLTAGISFVPVPGCAGAGEGFFRLVFASVFPADKLMSGMILSRGISPYSGIVFTGILLAAYIVADSFGPGRQAAGTPGPN
ncbi:MAG: lysylphosphatidylglycerol synthase transmembrane domain-containing protein [Anaerovoracaceae bacterium]|jgi:uncharacterized protein (TIRG00374 family)